MLRFAEPIFLYLLLLLPLFWLLSMRLRLISPGRRYTIIVLRTLLVLCLVLSLSQLEWRRISRDLSVFFLLDRSESVPNPELTKQLEYVDSLSRKATVRDQTGVIVFGNEPSIETSPVKAFDFEGTLLSQVAGERTDISAAVRLAMAAFPTDTMRRIVLVSDGNENIGSIIDVGRIARNNGIPIDVIPISYTARNDIKLDKIVVPQRTSKDAPFDLKVYISAEEAAQGTLRIFEDGNLIIEDDVDIRPGRNAPLVLSRRLAEGGFHTYTATIETRDDLRPQNNKANAFTFLRAEPRVLLIEGSDPASAAYLASALRTENIAVSLGSPNDIPTSLEVLQKFDTLILSNVPADNMSVAQMAMIERAVHDLGIGLVMIGGENSFGAGGYIDTPIEEALPVSMDVKQKKMLPNGALAVVLHTCEIPSGNAWAREISLASLNVLSMQDYFGIVYFGYSGGALGGGMGEVWLWQPGMQQVGDKTAMRTAIKGVQPLDAPAFDPLLRMAAEDLIKVKAQTKHIVVISDGDPSPPSQRTVQMIRDEGITVSGVAIAPHDPSTVNSLKDMAYWGSGNFYYPKTGNELPRIFTKEATIVRKSLIREDSFAPRFNAPSEVMLGFMSFPNLEGYVVTSIKDLATEALTTEWDDPLLAHWRYGLGKSVAFTSDAKDKWAANWVTWGSFSKFWAQTVRWSLRETNTADYTVNTELEGGTGRITIDAIDDAGNFKNFMDFQTTVIGPDFEPMGVDVRQVAPGRYEGTFPAAKVGTYMLSMVAGSDEGEDPQFLTSGVALSYSPEYETSSSADEFLKRIADSTGGVYIEDPGAYNPYVRNLIPAQRPLPMWPWLLLVAAFLLPADIFFRRVYLDWGAILEWVRTKVFGLFPRREAQDAYTTRMESLRAAKSRAARDKEEEKREREAREAFRSRLAEKAGTDAPEKSIFDKQQEAGPALRGQKQTFTADSEGASSPPPQGGMGALMEAKKRAQEQQRRKK